MSGMFQRIARRRAGEPEEQSTEVDVRAHDGTVDQPTQLLGAVELPQPPAPSRPGFRERGKMRRRLRYLRKVRELQARDLGGLVFDLRRFERKRDDLVAQKADQLRATDNELRALEIALEQRRELRDVHEPGIGGTCPRCFALFGSADRFCSHCGAALGGAVQGPAQVPVPAAAQVDAQPSGHGVPAGGQPQAPAAPGDPGETSPR